MQFPVTKLYTIAATSRIQCKLQYIFRKLPAAKAVSARHHTKTGSLCAIMYKHVPWAFCVSRIGPAIANHHKIAPNDHQETSMISLLRAAIAALSLVKVL